MEQNPNENQFYNHLKHVNKFLSSSKEYTTSDDEVDIDESIDYINNNDYDNLDIFTRPSDIFKNAKANLREKGEL